MKREGLVGVVVASCALLSGACASSGGGAVAGSATEPAAQQVQAEPLAAFVDRITTMTARNQAGPMWDLLVPQQQALVTRTAFLQCSGGRGATGEATVEVAEDPYEEDVVIPGTTETVSSQAISYKLSFEGSRDRLVTSHSVLVDGGWRWILPPDGIDACTGAQ